MGKKAAQKNACNGKANTACQKEGARFERADSCSRAYRRPESYGSQCKGGTSKTKTDHTPATINR